MAAEDDLYFRQLLSGRDFATRDPAAAQMVNFAYLIGSRSSGEAWIVDPAWDVDGLLAAADEDGMRVIAALATHFHPDHVGGDLFGTPVEGIARLLERRPIRVYAQHEEVPWIRETTGVSAGDLEPVRGGDRIRTGDVEITFLHTPGHSPGSQCFLVRDRLVAGDTLFLQGCGRVDLPGADPEAMYHSLTGPLAQLPDDTVLFPGHAYDPRPFATLGENRRENYVLQVRSLEDWMRMMGA
ncbi:MAG: MBL fold metallo-hydrolase [Acidobacteriota bacterium]|jgi:glyoxylase-like metal-dependent hydrolase (beta-lactamase superfamily II)